MAAIISPAESDDSCPKRFAALTDDNVNKIIDDKDARNTKKATDMAVNVFRAYLREKGMSQDILSYGKVELDSVLSKFYMEARTKKGELYKRSSLIALRHGLNRYLGDVDIISGQNIKKSKTAFTAMTTELKRQGLGAVEHHPPIEKQDLMKLYASFDVFKPESLQKKVFVDILLYFGRRGRENARELQVSDFACTTDANGLKFIYLTKDELTKNHREDNNTASGRMYEIPGADEKCPVKTFVRYLRMLPPGYIFLFPKARKHPNEEGLYFDRVPMGHNKLGKIMSDLSTEFRLSQKYTNHSLRATSVHLLDAAKIPSRHIMTVTGHKAESSLKTYTGYTDAATKRHMSETISNGTGITNTAKVKLNIPGAENVNHSTAVKHSTPKNSPFRFGECVLSPLSNSQMENLISEFDDGEFDKMLSDLPMEELCQQTVAEKKTVTFNAVSSFQPVLPTINAQNVVINYNIYQK